jgi:flagellar basal body P-ring protein FlgI
MDRLILNLKPFQKNGNLIEIEISSCGNLLKVEPYPKD